MERNLDTEAAIIVNDLASMCMRIEALQAHPQYTAAWNFVQKAKDAVELGRIAIHTAATQARFAKMDAA